MLNIIIGLLISLIYSKIILPKNEGDDTNILLTINPIIYQGMIIIKINNRIALHLHHWIIYLVIVLFINFYQIIIPEIIYWFFVFMTIQGLTYHDRFNFICRNPYN